MKKMIALLVLTIFSLSCDTNKKVSEVEAEITTYYFVRHAEKDTSDPTNRDPDLTKEGEERAQAWKDFFIDKKIDAVYSTKYKRTMRTALPTAKAINVDVINYDPSTLYNATFETSTKGKNVVVVGHSNTTPNFVNAILKSKEAPGIDESDYGNLYIVTVKDGVASFDKKHFD